jgi:hypothetical protein
VIADQRAILMTLPRQKPIVPQFELWVEASEGLSPVLLR